MKDEFEAIPDVSILANCGQSLTQNNVAPGSDFRGIRKFLQDATVAFEG